MKSSGIAEITMRLEKPSNRKGLEVLRFLDAHWLDHSPTNYAFAHRVLFEGDDALRHEVEQITDGGVRITPAQVAMLGGGPPINQEATPKLDRLTLRVLDVIGDAASATGSFNRDLINAAASLVAPNPIDPQTVIAVMIDRAAQAEASLADATRQARLIREELNALGGDATRDRLTGLPNREGSKARLDAATASRKGCALAVLDVDRLKRINDAYGHEVGDRVLQAISADVVESCRPHLVARCDGNTFVVLFEGLTAAEAGAIIDQARTRLSTRQLKVRESGAPLGTVTFSAGVASSRGRAAAELLASAMALLSRAKSNGRDRVEIEPTVIGVHGSKSA